MIVTCKNPEHGVFLHAAHRLCLEPKEYVRPTADGWMSGVVAANTDLQESLHEMDRMYAHEIAGLARQLDDSEAKLKAAHDTIEGQAGTIDRLESQLRVARAKAMGLTGANPTKSP